MQTALCCIGPITIDFVSTPHNTVQMPGGTAFYFASALAQMESSLLLVTTLAEPEKEVVKSLQKKGIHIRLFPSLHTLVFENQYGQNPDERTQKVVQQANPFTVEQLKDIDAAIVHLGPLLATDIPAAAITALAAKGKLSLDVQGFLRKVEGQTVVPVDWPEKKSILPHIHFLKLNEDELNVLTGEADIKKGAKQLAAWGAKEVVITLGSKGSVIYDGSLFYAIPAFAPQQVTDATGCGDTYMAGYLFQRNKGAGIWQAGTFAAAMATLKLSLSGPFAGTQAHVEALLKKTASGK